MFKVAKAISGQITPVIGEFDIATNTAITEGEAVKLSSGKVVAATDGAALLGVAAIVHGASKDMIHQYSGTDKIVVYCDPNQAFECPIEPIAVAAAVSANATSITFAGTASPTSLVGGHVLIDGNKYAISAASYATNVVTLTTAALPAIAASTKVVVVPPTGCKTGKFNSTVNGLSFVDGVTSAFVVVKATGDKVVVKPILHAFGCEE